MPTVDWEKVRAGVTRENERMIWRPYGLPTILDLERSAFTDEPISTPWPIAEPVGLTAAICGALFGKEQNEAQPISNDEILESAREALEAGASCIHLHVRDSRGYNSLSPDSFREVIGPLRAEFPGVPIDGCLVPALKGDWPLVQEVLAERLLDGVPINTTATYIGDSLFAKPAPIVIEKTRLVVESGAYPIISVYVDGDVSNADRWLFKTGLVGEGASWLILPALPGCSPMNSPRQMLEGLLRFTGNIYEVDPQASITICAAGRANLYLATAAAILGLDVRVGMEDTIWRWPHRGEKLASNAQGVTDAVRIIEGLGRRPATFEEFRNRLGRQPA